MQETNNSNKASIISEEQKQSLDERCKLVILSLHKDVQQSMSAAVTKSLDVLQMLQKLESNNSAYADAIQLLQQQKLSLRKGITVSAAANLADHQPQSLEPVNETLSKEFRAKLSRFQATFSKNKQLCQKQYQTLLRQTPLLANYHVFPEACSNLLYLSPNHWIKSVSKLLTAAPTTHQMSQDVYQLNELTVLNFFICELKSHYRSIQTCLEDILSEEDILPFKPAAQLKTARSLSVVKRSTALVTLSKKIQPATIPKHIVKTEKSETTKAQKIIHAPLVKASSAIKRQESLRARQSEFAQYQLATMPLGSLLFWQNGFNQIQGQTLKLVCREKELYTFHHEETGQFIRYAPSELVKAIISGQLYPDSEKKHKKKKFISKFIPKAFQ